MLGSVTVTSHSLQWGNCKCNRLFFSVTCGSLILPLSQRTHICGQQQQQRQRGHQETPKSLWGTKATSIWEIWIRNGRHSLLAKVATHESLFWHCGSGHILGEQELEWSTTRMTANIIFAGHEAHHWKFTHVHWVRISEGTKAAFIWLHARSNTI